MRTVRETAAIEARTAEQSGHEIALLIFLVTPVLIREKCSQDGMEEHLVVETLVHTFQAFPTAQGVV